MYLSGLVTNQVNKIDATRQTFRILRTSTIILGTAFQFGRVRLMADFYDELLANANTGNDPVKIFV
jgi:hypothetical protein